MHRRDVNAGLGTYVPGFGWVPLFDRIDAPDGTLILVDDRLAGTGEVTASGRRIVFVSRTEAVRIFIASERAARGDGQAPSGHALSESVELIRVVTAAELLGVSRDTLDRLIRSLPDHLKPEIQPTKGVGRRKTYFWRNRAHLLRWHEEALASKRPSVPVAPPHTSNRPAAKVIEGEAVTDWRAVANQVGRAKKG